MNKTFNCIITSSTYYGSGAHFEFELADHQYDLWLTQILQRKAGLKCRLVIAETQKYTPMIIDRWSEGPLTYCLPEDVEQLEALNAELLEALNSLVDIDYRSWDDAAQQKWQSACAAIAKAEGKVSI